MNILRAAVRSSKDQAWWEVRLLDLNVRADGENEAEMLRQLEHALIAEYHLALKFGKTPFVDLLLAVPSESASRWEDCVT